MDAAVTDCSRTATDGKLSGLGVRDELTGVLFVCTGNTCRSPMAAAVLTDLGQAHGYVASSAGLYPAPGAPISENAVLALGERGIVPARDNRYDLHRAVRVTEEMVRCADRIVGITSSHAMALIGAFPFAADKIVAMPRDIPDPFGGSRDDYLRCLDEIIKGVKELFPVGS